MKDFKQEILRITAPFFEPTIDHDTLDVSIKEYRNFLIEHSEIDFEDDSGRDDIQSATGNAIGVFWAEYCVNDPLRTRQFIRGIDKAIDELVHKKKANIQLLYAGTGPYAALILPLLFKWENVIDCDLMEINPLSIRILRTLLSNLSFSSDDFSFLLTDAATYDIPVNKSYDIVISETMQAGLEDEQQVAIFMNLARQTKPSTVFIPQNITLSLAFKNNPAIAPDQNEPEFEKIADIFTLNKADLCAMPSVWSRNQPFHFPTKNITINNNESLIAKHLYLITEIQVFEDIHLHTNESGLNAPLLKAIIDKQSDQKVVISTQYILNETPEMLVQVIN